MPFSLESIIASDVSGPQGPQGPSGPSGPAGCGGGGGSNNVPVFSDGTDWRIG